jgi:hypothetical protein
VHHDVLYGGRVDNVEVEFHRNSGHHTGGVNVRLYGT